MYGDRNRVFKIVWFLFFFLQGSQGGWNLAWEKLMRNLLKFWQVSLSLTNFQWIYAGIFCDVKKLFLTFQYLIFWSVWLVIWTWNLKLCVSGNLNTSANYLIDWLIDWLIVMCIATFKCHYDLSLWLKNSNTECFKHAAVITISMETLCSGRAVLFVCS